MPVSFLNRATNQYQVENVPVKNPKDFEEMMREVNQHFSAMRYQKGGIVVITETEPFQLTYCGTFMNTFNSTQWENLVLESGLKYITRKYTGNIPPGADNITQGAAANIPMVLTSFPNRIKHLQDLRYEIRSSNSEEGRDERMKSIICKFCSYFDPEKDNDGFNHELREEIKNDLEWLKIHPVQDKQSIAQQKAINYIENSFIASQKIWSNSNSSTHYQSLPQPQPVQSEVATQPAEEEKNTRTSFPCTLL